MPDAITGTGPGSLIVAGGSNVIHIGAAAFARSEQARHYLRMLAVIAAPVANRTGDGPPGGPPLDVWGEWERLRGAIEDADPVTRAAAPWAVVRLAEPTAERLRDALAPADPGYQAVHFSCHGCPDGVWLEDSLGRERFMPTAALIDALRHDGARPAPELVVLNACETLSVAQALVAEAGVRAVVATCTPIFDLESQLLAERLYRWLAAGQTVGAALAEFRRSLIERLTNGDLPHLGNPAERAANVQLVGDPALTLRVDGPPAERPLFVLHQTPHNDLPLMSTVSGFVGRSAELLTLARWFGETGRLAFALSGVGGIGKTALALNAALRHAHRFNALAFASAKARPDFGLQQVLDALNRVLGLSTSPEEAGDLAGAIARRLNERPVLLVLDNLESLSPQRTAELAGALASVDVRGRSRVLMTLRPRDRDPLTGLAGADRLILNALDRSSALRLAWEEAERQHLDLTQGLPPVTLSPRLELELKLLRQRAWLPWLDLAVVAALDGLTGLAFRHPAMIELAIPMLRERGWEGTRRRLERLKGEDVTDALDDFIGQMADDLAIRAPAARAALYAVLPFAGPAEASRLRYVLLGRETPDDSDETIDIEDRLQPAVSANLLRRDRGRYDLDVPVRAYLALRRPPDPGLRVLFERRHAEAFLPVAADDETLWSDSTVSLGALPDWDDIVTALDRLTSEAVQDDAAARLLIAYVLALPNILRNKYDIRRDAWLTIAADAADRIGDAGDQANVLQAQGDVLYFLKQTDEALARYDQALGLFRAVGARLGEANVLKAQGQMALQAGAVDEGMGLLDAARALYIATGSRVGVLNCGILLARYAAGRGEFAAAIAYMQPAADFCMEINHPLGPQFQAEIDGWKAQLA